MKQITCRQGVMLVGNETAHLLSDCDCVLRAQGRVDAIEIRTIGPDGKDSSAIVVLGGEPFTTAPTDSALSEPGNSEAHRLLRILMVTKATSSSDPTAACTEGAGDWD